MKSAAVCLFGLAALTACGTGDPSGSGPTGSPSTPEVSPGTPAPETPPAAPATETPVGPGGFPCDVHAVLQTHCAGCHVDQTYSIPFWTRDHLLVLYRGTTTLGQVAADAVRDLRMPRYGTTSRPTAAEREIFLAWVAGGMRAGTCGELTRPVP